MMGGNHLYDHSGILARYCGLPRAWPIPGEVQHGWTPANGVFESTQGWRPRRPRVFVWGRHNIDSTRSASGLPVVAIGAPIHYHRPPIERERRGSLLVCPAHGWEGGQLDGDLREYVRAVVALKDRFSDITVCLYWYDHSLPGMRELYEREGFPVVTAGNRDANPRFLDDLSLLLTRHEYVTSNVLTTAVFYAIHLGRKAFLYGDPIYVSTAPPDAVRAAEAARTGRCAVLSLDRFGDRRHEDVAAEELGRPFVQSPDALRAAFGWDRPAWRVRTDALARAAADPLARRLPARLRAVAREGIERRWMP